ncbi:MAG: hypothetical protein CMP67_10695 [Flavobacteriales bacterium]|nr:hypothetical protein [Flavobacteriales bacterium]MBO72388.1 hypothetical protein [Flavobacteriales bacterium]|tara:strand:+ start:803 stop:1591 length:789 start_codon:yes stop_codon:yes gene_type:complete
MRFLVVFFLFANLMLFSQNYCNDLPVVTLDSLNNFNSDASLYFVKVPKDSSIAAFRLQGGFEYAEIFYDSCQSEHIVKIDSNGFFTPTLEMIYSGICCCKSCTENFSKISTKRDVFIKIVNPKDIRVIKYDKTVKKDYLWYEKKLKSGDKIRLENILFYGGESRFRPVSYKDLNRLYVVLQENLNLKIEIQGHVNSPGRRNSKKNQDLSEARAKAVSNYLVKKGIDVNRITSVGYGNTQMIYPNTKKESEMQFNRRVEILVK